MSLRKLAVLGYPADYIDFDDEEQVCQLVQFLEDQHICMYKIDEREVLRSTGSSWHKAFTKYLKNLKCPLSFENDSVKEIVDWILNYAISLLYKETSKAQSLTSSNFIVERSKRDEEEKAKDPIGSLDFECEEFKKNVEEIRKLIGISRHPDHKIVLSAICEFISKNLSDTAIKGRHLDDTQTPMDLNKFELGMASNGKAIDITVRALRLLHLEHLREVQTQINEAIVAVQEITADPKTDKRLGKVGF